MRGMSGSILGRVVSSYGRCCGGTTEMMPGGVSMSQPIRSYHGDLSRTLFRSSGARYHLPQPRLQSTSSKNNVPATAFALYGAMGLKPSDLSSAAASFIDGSVSNLILAYTSPDRG